MKTTLEQLEINGEVLDITEYATKEEIHGVLASKADKASTYTKTEVDTLVAQGGGGGGGSSYSFIIKGIYGSHKITLPAMVESIRCATLDGNTLLLDGASLQGNTLVLDNAIMNNNTLIFN